MDVLLHGKNRLLLVRILQFLRQFIHSQIVIFVSEWEELKLKIDFRLHSILFGLFGHLFSCEFSFLNSPIVCLL